MNTTYTSGRARRPEPGPQPDKNEAAPPGFISAFRFAGGQALRLSWDEARDAITGDGPTWLHLSANDDTVEGWLEGVSSMPDVAREFLNGEDKRPRVHMGPNFMYGVVADLELVAATPAGAEPGAREAIRATGALRFYVDRNRMITVRARPLQSTDRLRHAVLEGAMFRDTVDLFAGLIRALNETFADRIDEIGDRLDDVEEGVLEGGHSNWRVELGVVRRRLVEVKRFIDPERNALTQLVTRRLEWAEPRSMEALVQAIQVLNGLGGGLEGLYERAKLLQDEIAALLSEDINRKLLWLAIMSALLLPATLVTGIFGMNVAGLPGTHNPASFWVVVGVMAGCAAITIFLLRRLRLW
ncbi:transporter [Caballeronia sp. LP006]|uniref:transporter n=1 Tax=Caballeronia sp. LP006 TaxID=3038552 RepID=UPI00285F81A0|nr:transporter [Caballeronia sp. LP006]MDR5830791.1 transporter [Caballeronia sp. LP006]